MRAFVWITAAVLSGAAQAAPPSACTVTSPNHTVALVELFTSEGCPNCPSADRWLRHLPAAGLGVDRVVPLALHVDYWDDKGWTDRFAKSHFTDRQKEYSALSGVRFIYTPQVVLGGRDTRRWREGEGFAEDVRAVNAKPARATITVTIEPSGAGISEVRVRARALRREDGAGAALYVAVYESSLESRVSAGDNSGLILEHDYVVRQWIGSVSLESPGGDGTAIVTGKIAHAGSGRAGVAAFVQTRRTGEILQAVALPHCGRATGAILPVDGGWTAQ